MWRCPQRPSLGDRRDVWRNRMVNSLSLFTYPAEPKNDDEQLTKDKGYRMTEENSQAEVPEALEPPINLGGDIQQFEAWKGATTLRREGKQTRGEARVVLDLMPVPEFRLEFTPETKPTLKDVFLDSPLGEGVIDCGPPIGPISCHVTSTGSSYSGYLEGQVDVETEKPVYVAATFLILNGPVVHGKPVNRGRSSYLGRMSAKMDDAEVIIDLLSSKKQPRRSIYESTHVARCTFSEPVSLSRIDSLATNLFRCLSLMKCRWVGLLGPWLQSVAPTDIDFRVAITKTMRNGGAISWCHESMGDCFSELAPVISTSFADPSRAEPLQTALHWLVESEQCAGGVEGAIILQQAALECLAWLEIVVVRQICSESGFKSLPASDKIRWLLSLHNIEAAIPNKSASITSYAKAFNLRDLIDVLVDVRNALVHAEPKKAARLFARNQGNEERGDLWYQVGGILQQAFLASLGYRGVMLRRDVDAEYAVGAVKPVPWTVRD